MYLETCPLDTYTI